MEQDGVGQGSHGVGQGILKTCLQYCGRGPMELGRAVHLEGLLEVLGERAAWGGAGLGEGVPGSGARSYGVGQGRKPMRQGSAGQGEILLSGAGSHWAGKSRVEQGRGKRSHGAGRSRGNKAGAGDPMRWDGIPLGRARHGGNKAGREDPMGQGKARGGDPMGRGRAGGTGQGQEIPWGGAGQGRGIPWAGWRTL